MEHGIPVLSVIRILLITQFSLALTAMSITRRQWIINTGEK
jgi:hypothetical protein